MRTVDNKALIVPDRKILSDNIINESREPPRRVDITISVAYGVGIDADKPGNTKKLTLPCRVVGRAAFH